jgi:hypothetical protein
MGWCADGGAGQPFRSNTKDWFEGAGEWVRSLGRVAGQKETKKGGGVQSATRSQL